MTVLIYVNTSKQVGDADHLKVFANADAAETWFEENDPEGVHSNMRSWSEPDRAPNHLCHAADRGLGDPVEFVASIISTHAAPSLCDQSVQSRSHTAV
jgi:hypothetical protein